MLLGGRLGARLSARKASVLTVAIRSSQSRGNAGISNPVTGCGDWLSEGVTFTAHERVHRAGVSFECPSKPPLTQLETAASPLTDGAARDPWQGPRVAGAGLALRPRKQPLLTVLGRGGRGALRALTCLLWAELPGR